MKPRNLTSVYEGAVAIEKLECDIDKRFKSLKIHEIRNLGSFLEIMSANGCGISHFDGYFVGYTIAQISKEFDFLRFGTDYILDIEIKSELKVANKLQKIHKQMKENYYYLKFLGKPIKIFTYVENDGFYEYDKETEQAIEVEPSVVAASMISCKVDDTIDPAKAFVPSNYLISPFNSTDKFIHNEYFLTGAQQKIKDEIQCELAQNPFMIFCISANAGTGKTLLTYDIAKQLIALGKKVLMVHCGKLNEGHLILRAKYNWDIRSIRDIPNAAEYEQLEDFDYIFVDESQRIRELQLKAIILKAQNSRIPIIFSFDTKQYLRTGETTNISEYVEHHYPSIQLSTKKLTNKIRTNKEMASFITNLMRIGKGKDHLNYEAVTVEYMDTLSEAKQYINFLSDNGWTPITYTTSSINPESYAQLAHICDKNAHDVIGQEFSKVVVVMDDNFKYNEQGELMFRNSYYSADGMLYQIVTRVVDELKVVVLDNPELYLKLLEIKAMGE